MTAMADWQKGNDDYLAAALEWLRLKLARQAAGDTVTEEQLNEAAAAMAAAEAGNPPPALIIATQRLGLSRFEQYILLLCAAMELDPGVAALCAAADDPNRPYPTFSLAMRLFAEHASWDALSPEHPLRYLRILEINQPGAQPLITSALRADERMVSFLKGLNYLDDRLTALLIPFDIAGSDAELPPSQLTAAESIEHVLRQAAPPHQPVINLAGPDSESKQLVARYAAAALGLLLYRLPAESLPPQAAELETLARLWQRESALLPLALYLDAHRGEGSAPTEAHAAPLDRFVARTGSAVFLATRDVWPGLGRPSIAFDIAKPAKEEQRAAWISLLGEPASDDAASLAAQFDLNLSAIRRIAGGVLAETEAGQVEKTALHRRLWNGCLAAARPRLDHLAQRLDARARLRDVVLPPDEKELLNQITQQVGNRSRVYEEWGFGERMNRGLGISALFAGDSGTGKTMAAEGIANALHLDLYRIDLAAVVSKYIGETPKNLRQLFDSAEDGGAILFFDEADALFGKRSEVKDSHDRYANIEIDYLLQRIEAYRGLAILATNMKSALDPAFLRRIRFVVNFSYPDAVQRREIWKKIFPKKTKTEGLDYDRLARLDLTGGSIHSIALNAAFLAARTKEQVVTMPIVLDAARTEFRKMDKFINEADLRWEPPAKEKIA